MSQVIPTENKSCTCNTNLTPIQQAVVDVAREALEASRQSTDYAGHCGLLEYHVNKLLGLIGDLTGSEK